MCCCLTRLWAEGDGYTRPGHERPPATGPRCEQHRRHRRPRIPWPFRRGAQVLVLALVVEYLVLPQLAGARKSLHLLLDLENAWLVVAVVCETASLIAFAAATRAMITAAHRPSMWRVLRIDLSTIGLSHCVPGGAAAGTALGLRLLTDSNVPIGEAAFAKITQGVGSAIVLQALLWTGLAVAIPLHGNNPLYLIAAAAGLALLTLASAWLLLLRRGRPAARRAAGTCPASLTPPEPPPSIGSGNCSTLPSPTSHD